MKIPADILARQQTSFHLMLIYAALCGVACIFINVGHMIAYANTESQLMRIGFNLASAIVCIVGWLLSAKCHVKFPGFSVLLACLAVEAKFEEILIICQTDLLKDSATV